jgi:hypothetical protein
MWLSVWLSVAVCQPAPLACQLVDVQNMVLVSVCCSLLN